VRAGRGEPEPISMCFGMLACFGRGEQHVIEENFSHGLAYFTKLYIPFFLRLLIAEFRGITRKVLTP